MPIEFQAETWQIAFALASCATLATMVLAKELRRASKKRLGLRAALSVVAILALAFIALEPTRTATPAPKNVALLTDEIESALMDSLIQTNDVELFSFKPNPKATQIQDAGFLARNFPTSEIHVFGDGLNHADLSRLRGRKLAFRQSQSPKGVIELHCPQRLALGETLTLKGRVRGTFERLTFKANGIAADSLANLNGETAFEFSFAPKHSGKLNLALVLDGKEERWGAFVFPPKPLSVLLLQAKPTFEAKHLKNFLTENDYRFAARIMVGKDRYREEFWNLRRLSLAPLSRNALARFDLLLIDGETLASLSPSERLAIENAVAQEGLGMFITEIDSALLTNASFKALLPFRFRAHQPRERTLFGRRFKSPPIALEAMTIQKEFGMRSLLEDSDGKSVAAFRQTGFGRIAVSLVEQTFQWRLEGKTDVYAGYWANLLSALAKPASETTITLPSVAIANEPIEFVVQTPLDSPRVVVQEDSQQTLAPLRQDALNPTLWRGRHWAREEGWIAFNIDGGARGWAFVSDETAFDAMRRETRRNETMKFIAQNVVQERETSDSALGAHKKSERDSALIFWCALCFVLALGGLWTERKI